MMDRAIFISISSFLLGVFVSSFIFISPLVSVWLLVISGGIFIAEKVNTHVSLKAFWLSLFIGCFALGSFRYAVKDFHEFQVPSSDGVVVSEPEQRDNSTRFVFRANNGERVLVSTDLYAEVKYGDRVKVGGDFEKPGVIEEGGGRSFDYGKYLEKDEIYFVVSFAEVEVVGTGEGNPIKSFLLKIKESFKNRIQDTFSEPYASLLSGLLLAGKDAMPKDLLEEFRRAGIIHIVVLSGYNITLVADFLRRLLEKSLLFSRVSVSPVFASGASILGILLFVLMTGAEATVVRAALMVLSVISAKMIGRNYSAPRALLLAGLAMVLHNPKILVFDPSFQLSFLATLALIYAAPIVENYLSFVTERFELRSIMATTIGTQLFVLPLLVYSVGEISLVSLPANILVLLTIPYTMFLGFVAATVSYVSFLLALPFAYLAHLLLAWTLGVSHFLGNIKFASIKVMEFSPVLLLIIYLLLFTFLWLSKSSLRRFAN